MAKITIVDENDNVIGSEEREVAVKKGLYHRIARVIVKNSKGEIYLQKRGKHVPTWPDRWDQSVGGHVDAGEDYITAAKREMKEELGIEGVELKFLEKWFQNEAGSSKKLKRFNALYEAVYNGEIILSDESSGGGWFSDSKIKEWMKEKQMTLLLVVFLLLVNIGILNLNDNNETIGM